MIFTKAKKGREIDLCKSFNSLEMRWSLLFAIWGILCETEIRLLTEFRTRVTIQKFLQQNHQLFGTIDEKSASKK